MLPCPCPSLAGWKLSPLLLRKNPCTTKSSSCGLCSLSQATAPLFPAAVSVGYFTPHNHNCDNVVLCVVWGFFVYFWHCWSLLLLLFVLLLVLVVCLLFSWLLKKPFRRYCFHVPSNKKRIGFQHLFPHRLR